MRTYLERLLLEGPIKVRVTPNSKKSEILGFRSDILQVRLNSPPDKGKANQELLKLMKKKFDRNFKIIKGEKSRDKLIS